MNKYVKYSLIAFTVAIVCTVAAYVKANAAEKGVKEALDTVVQLNESCSGVIVESQLYDTVENKPFKDIVEEKEKEGISKQELLVLENYNVEFRTKILTAKHCITKDYGFVNMLTARDDGIVISENRLWYDVDKKSDKYDLALITLREDKYYNPAEIAKKTLVDLGDDVIVIGFPFISSKIVSEGLFNGMVVLPNERGSDKVESYYRSTPPIAPGNSGGGLFQPTENGYELIGISSKVYPGYGHTGYFVPLKDIKDFLNKDDEDKEESLEDLLNKIKEKVKEEENK